MMEIACKFWHLLELHIFQIESTRIKIRFIFQDPVQALAGTAGTIWNHLEAEHTFHRGARLQVLEDAPHYVRFHNLVLNVPFVLFIHFYNRVLVDYYSN